KNPELGGLPLRKTHGTNPLIGGSSKPWRLWLSRKRQPHSTSIACLLGRGRLQSVAAFQLGGLAQTALRFAVEELADFWSLMCPRGDTTWEGRCCQPNAYLEKFFDLCRTSVTIAERVA